MHIYQKNSQHYQTNVAQLTKELQRLSILRVVVFVGSATLLLVLANQRWLMSLLLALPLCVLGFGLVLNRYHRLAYHKQQAAFLQQVNEEERLRLENKLAGFPTGEGFLQREHAYAADLDVFGTHSLFQLLNRTTTEAGKERLAQWLSAPAAKEVILARQQAVKELAAKLAWRQQFQATGMHYSNPKSNYQKLVAWVEKPVALLPRQKIYLTVNILLTLLTLVAIVYAFATQYSFSSLPLVGMLFINALYLKRIKPIAEEIIESTHYNVKVLGGYHSLITLLESEPFEAPLLGQLQTVFGQQGYSAADQIKKLKNILELAKLKGTSKTSLERNLLYPAVNNFLLLDVYWILLTDAWKARNSRYLRGWAEAVGEFEALSSIAGFAYSNPAYSFPQISQEPYQLHFQGLGHPLIPAERRVCNDFDLAGRGEIALITGSNMAGKSTFLRTVGVNLILAWLGAPCCAKAAQVPKLTLFTSMRTQDNLEEGISSFRAELLRIEQLLKLIESGQAVFFLLDEMFKGTNSRDRYKGGVSLIKQLSDLNAFGLISSHDLELAKIAAHYLQVVNYSFNSQLQAGEMTFDYRLTEGICQDFNASELMQRSGIKILSTIDQIS
jgi:hypothetical protein